MLPSAQKNVNSAKFCIKNGEFYMNTLHKSLLTTSIVSICSTVAFSASAATITEGFASFSAGVTAGFSGDRPGTAELNAETTPNATTTFDANVVNVGREDGGDGTLRVIGDGTAGSAVLTTGSLRVGADSVNRIEVLNGGQLISLREGTGRSQQIIIGADDDEFRPVRTDGSTTVIVDGDGSLLESNGRLTIGFQNDTPDSFTISNSGRVVVKEPDNFAERVTAASDPGEGASGVVSLGGDFDNNATTQALDTLTVTGAGSELVYSSGIFTNTGNNRIVVSDGGAILQVETGDIDTRRDQFAGFDDNSFGIQLGSAVGESSLTVEGAGSRVTSTRGVSIGAGNVFVGFGDPDNFADPIFEPSNAEVTVRDGATLSTAGELRVSDEDGEGTGFLTVASGGRVEADTVIVNGGGLLSGDGGTIVADVVLNGGTIAPGASPGIMNIDGDLEVLDGLLSFEIGGSAIGMFDQLFISGDLITPSVLNIEISFLDSFLAQAGDSFDFLTVDGNAPIFGDPDSISFSFLGDNPGLDFSFNSGGFSAVVTGGGGVSPVPLPASLPLLLAAIGGLGWRARKSKAA